MKLEIPEGVKPVLMTAGAVTTNGGVTGDYISMKNVHRATIICIFDQAVGHATGIDPTQATLVDGTGVKAFAKTLKIWANEDGAASDALVRKTDAVTYNVAADIKTKMVVIQVDGQDFDVANGFDCLGLAIDDSSQATNFVAAIALLEMRYAQATPPSAIVD